MFRGQGIRERSRQEFMIVKTRKVGNSTVLTVPKDFNIKVAKEYKPKLLADGSILFAPKSKKHLGTVRPEN